MRESGLYRDRRDAGRRLGARLEHLAAAHPIVLAIPRGGVPIGREIADTLEAPLDIVLVRKLPIPFAPETALGVVADDGTAIVDQELVTELGLEPDTIEEVTARVMDVLRRYAAEFEGVRPEWAPDRADTIILVDDGLATGYTMLGAARVARQRGAQRIVVAAPVSSDTAAERLAEEVDEFVCPIVDPGFVGVSAYYEHFEQLDDDDVRRILGERRGD